MEENDALMQHISELEERVSYIEQKFNISKGLPEIMFPTTANVIAEVPQMTNGEE